jgi:hypothetical protein
MPGFFRLPLSKFRAAIRRLGGAARETESPAADTNETSATSGGYETWLDNGQRNSQ